MTETLILPKSQETEKNRPKKRSRKKNVWECEREKQVEQK